jgi:hypothetical protein
VAGDWIKMEAATPDKGEVLAITAAMGWDDPDLTVGKLFRVWRWFDQQTVDGNAPGVTSALLDRIVGVPGFAEAMRNVGWLTIETRGLSLPNFSKHNGKTAKARALTANRVSNFKAANAEGNAEVTLPPLPREEKRREERESKDSRPKRKAASDPPRFDEESSEMKAARFLFGKIRENNEKAKEPNWQAWAREFDRIFRIDKLTLDEVLAVIAWSHSDSFWLQNILSPATLRKHFDRLTVAMKKGGGNGRTKDASGGVKGADGLYIPARPDDYWK